MSNEKMTELKIIIPKRWLNFINEYYQVSGRDRDEDLMMMFEAQIRMPMLEDDLLPVKERIRLHDKYQLSDICEIPPRVRDEAAGIAHPGKPEKTPDDSTEILVTEKELVDLIDESRKRNPFGILVLGSMIGRGELRIRRPNMNERENQKDLIKILELRRAIMRSISCEHC